MWMLAAEDAPLCDQIVSSSEQAGRDGRNEAKRDADIGRISTFGAHRPHCPAPHSMHTHTTKQQLITTSTQPHTMLVNLVKWWLRNKTPWTWLSGVLLFLLCVLLCNFYIKAALLVQHSESGLFICRCSYMTFPNAIHLHMKVPLFFFHFFE